MSARSTISSFSSALGHSRQANQLREQLQGLLPDSAAPAVAAVKRETGDGMQKLLDYVRLAAEYQEPVIAVIRRVIGRAPEVRLPAAVQRRRGINWRPVIVVGIIAGIGVLAYEMSKTSRRPARDA